MLILPRRTVYKPAEGGQIAGGHPLADGLQAFWLLNEGGGKVVEDLVTCRIRGTLSGSPAPTWGAGPTGAALKFNGSSSFVQLPYDPALNCPNGITLVARFAPLNTSRVVFGKPFTTTQTSPFFDWVMYQDITRAVNFRIGTTTLLSTGLLTLGLSSHVALVADGVNFRWYINGHLDRTTAAAALPTNANSRGVRIGANAAGGEVFGGTIDHCMVYDRALGADQVRWLYDEPFAMLGPPAAGQRFWTFQQFKGTAAVAPPKGTLAGSGAEKLGGTASEAPPKPTLAASAAETVTTSGGLAPPTSSLALAASETFGATVTESPPAAGIAATAAASLSGSATETPPKSTLSANGGERFAATGSESPPESVLVASGSERLAGTGAEAAPHATLAGASAERLTATGSLTAPHPTLAATGAGTIQPAQPSGGSRGRPIGDARGLPGFTWQPPTRVAAGPPPTIDGTAEVIAPAARVEASGRVRQVIAGIARVGAPVPSLAAAATWEMPRIAAVARVAAPSVRVDGAACLSLAGVAAVEHGRREDLAKLRRRIRREIEDEILLGVFPEPALLRVA